MIQRIQTVYLFLAAALMSFMFLPTFEFLSKDPSVNTDTTNALLQDGLYNSFDNTLLLILVITVAAMFLINIFLFKNRRLQISLTRVAFIGALSIIVVAGIIFYQNAANVNEELKFVQVRLGLFMPVLAMVLSWLAIKNIKKDDKIVRSMDRLR